VGYCGAFLESPDATEIGSGAVLGAAGEAAIGDSMAGPPGAVLATLVGAVLAGAAEGK
jgi:hypothetical protein